MAEAEIATLDGAVVQYSTRPIGPINLTVSAGEIVAVVGASGSGKSTLLRLLAGLETAASGSVRLAARDRTGFVFQSHTLAPWLDARANVALPLRLSGVPGPEADRRAAEALAAVGLDGQGGLRPAQLSGGMAMRVSLARALVADPMLILLDEPFAALDSITRRRLIEDLHGLWDQRRPAIVFVTHDVEEAVYLADRIVVLDAATGSDVVHLQSPGSLPRPPGWRADLAYRRAVETVAAALADAMPAEAA